MLELGGIDRYSILKTKVDQKAIFESLGFNVSLDHQVINPLRDDNNPGCSFAWFQGFLLFSDFTNYFTKISINCFEAYEFVHSRPYIPRENKLLEGTFKEFRISSVDKKKISIKIKAVTWPNKHYLFDIPSRILHEESTYLVKEYWCNTSRHSTMVLNRFNNPTKDLTIAYVFPSGKMKLYFPNNELRFYGNITKEDVWGLKNLKKSNNKLIITKSGADYLCYKHVLGYDVIAPNAEWPIIPDSVIAKIQSFNYEEIIIIFDNDKAGIRNSLLLQKYLEVKEVITRVSFLPNEVRGSICKDPKSLYMINKLELKRTIKEIYNGRFYRPTAYEEVVTDLRQRFNY